MTGKELERFLGQLATYSLIRLDAVGRALRAADLLPTGGRGLAAASLDPTHVANFLIAMSLEGTPSKAASRVPEYRHLRLKAPKQGAVETFGEMIDALLTQGVGRASVSIVREYPRATVTINGQTAVFGVQRPAVYSETLIAPNIFKSLLLAVKPNRPPKLISLQWDKE